MKYEIKTIPKGNKGMKRFVCYEDGVEIGSRQSKRDYVKCVVVKHNKGRKISDLLDHASTQLAYAEEEEACAKCSTVEELWEVKGYSEAEKTHSNREFYEKCIRDNKFAEYAANSRRRYEESMKSVKELEADDPKWTKRWVNSWHMSKTAKSDAYNWKLVEVVAEVS